MLASNTTNTSSVWFLYELLLPIRRKVYPLICKNETYIMSFTCSRHLKITQVVSPSLYFHALAHFDP